MARNLDDPTRLIREFRDLPPHGGIVLSDVNESLLDRLFAELYGNWHRLMERVARTKTSAIKAAGNAGFGNVLSQLFLDLKAGFGIEGGLERERQVEASRELVPSLKLALCDAALRTDNQIAQNPASLEGHRYLRLVNCLSTFVDAETDSPKLHAEVGQGPAEAMLRQWQRDQQQTPGSKQILLAGSVPSPAAAIIMAQPQHHGDTYLSYPPMADQQRVLIGQAFAPMDGVTFLKTYAVFEEKSA